jgi:RecB family endonuclease NucS
MSISVLTTEHIDLKEKEIQAAFERDLSKLEDGLEFIKSELVIGTGRIDTLA